MIRQAYQVCASTILFIWCFAGNVNAFADTQQIPKSPLSTFPLDTTLDSNNTTFSVLTLSQNGFARIAKSAEPFVVNITAMRPAPFDAATDLLPNSIPKLPGSQATPSFPREEEATGSGLIVRPDGYILTNDHVVEGSPTVTVTLSDGRDFVGKVIPDYHSDLALVKIDNGGTPLPCAQFDADDDVQSGQWAIAIGSPFDLQNTMTVGVISALHRHQTIGDSTDQRFYPDLIQTDAAINPGNSGGPLLNIMGEVVGVNVAIESPVDGSSGVGFAIPANIAIYVVDQLIKNGKVVRGYLGIDPEDIPPSRANDIGVTTGAWVRQVMQDSPAGRAGIHAADVVTAINGKPVENGVSLRNAIAESAPGSMIKLDVIRDSKPLSLSATVAAPPPSSTDNIPVQQPTRRVGLTYKELTPAGRQELGVSPDSTGVVVSQVAENSPAYDSDFYQNDIIEQIGHKHIVTVADASTALDAITPGVLTTVVVLRTYKGVVQELALDLKL